MSDQTDQTDPSDPGPSEPPQDIIEEQDFDFSLDDMNRVAAEMFGDTDADETADAGSDPDPDANPEPVAAEGGADEPAPSSVSEAGDGTPSDEQGGSQAPTPEAPPAPAQPPTVTLGGQTYRAEDIEGLVNWVSTLSPEQLAVLNAQPEPHQPEPAVGPLPAEDEIIDPRLAEWTQSQLGSLEQKVDLLLQQQQAQQEILAAQYMAEQNAALDTARRGVAEDLGLSDDEAERLLAIASETPAAMAVVQNYDLNADPVGAYTAALQAAYWLTPEFRERAIQSQVTSQVAQLSVDAALSSKKELNQGLVGAGAATPRETTKPLETEQDHLAAAIALARESMTAN